MYFCFLLSSVALVHFSCNLSLFFLAFCASLSALIKSVCLHAGVNLLFDVNHFCTWSWYSFTNAGHLNAPIFSHSTYQRLVLFNCTGIRIMGWDQSSRNIASILVLFINDYIDDCCQQHTWISDIEQPFYEKVILIELPFSS